MAAKPPPPPPASLARVPGYGTRVSRTYEPDDPEVRKKRVRPFRLDELEHIPAEQKNLYNALWASMPEVLFQRGVTLDVVSMLKNYTEVDLDIWFDGFRTYETRRLRSLIPGTACILVLGLAPREEKLLLELDLQFAYRLINELLGTKDAAIDVHRPLTEIEQGVLSFLVLKALSQIQGKWSHPEQLALRLEDIRNDIRGTADILKHESLWLCARWKLFHNLDVGVARLLIPEGFATSVVLERPPPNTHLAIRRRNRIRERLAPYRNTTTEAWVEVGSLELGRSDLEELDPGDIILLDHTTMQMDEHGGVSGAAEMKIGLGEHGVLRGVVHSQEGEQVFELQEIAAEEVPNVHNPVEGHGDYENPEELVAGYEEGGHEEGEYEAEEYESDEANDGSATSDDLFDEDHGIDDEDGDEEEYEEEEYEEEEYEEGAEGEYEEGEYEEGAEGGYEEGGYEEAEVEAEDDNLAEAEPLLGDIPMLLVVELGRVQLTADEVIRLRAGQLIELGRAPTDPVDLVVNGKLVAKGELVEIEGALGVKLINLVKGEE